MCDTMGFFSNGTAIFAKNSDRIMAYVEYDNILPLEPRELTVATPAIEWDRIGNSAVKIQTDSESVIGSVSVDGKYLGSTVESNMLLHEGLLTIGRSELVSYSLGTHQMLLTFDDGAVPVTLTIYETYLKGDANNDGKITINDVTDIQRLLAELTEDPSGTVARRCNVDGEELSVTDVTAIQRFLAEFAHDPYHIGSEARDFGSETDENALPFVPE